jgi:hypothetical protein
VKDSNFLAPNKSANFTRCALWHPTILCNTKIKPQFDSCTPDHNLTTNGFGYTI